MEVCLEYIRKEVLLLKIAASSANRRVGAGKATVFRNLRRETVPVKRKLLSTIAKERLSGVN